MFIVGFYKRIMSKEGATLLFLMSTRGDEMNTYTSFGNGNPSKWKYSGQKLQRKVIFYPFWEISSWKSPNFSKNAPLLPKQNFSAQNFFIFMDFQYQRMHLDTGIGVNLCSFHDPLVDIRTTVARDQRGSNCYCKISELIK